MQAWRTVRKLRGLVVDVENKPGTYGPGDYTHPKLTAIGWGWLDRQRVRGVCLIRTERERMRWVAEQLRVDWDKADFIVGHNFRRHDVKLLDGFYSSLDLPLLARKRIVDTYLDMPRMQGYSRSLENLAYRWECPIKKLHLSESEWEAAYDETPAGLRVQLARVKSDVAINRWLHGVLVKKGLLKW